MGNKIDTNSWIWPHDNGVNGATINLETGTFQWFDNPGCACGDNANEQSAEDFLKNGPLFGDPPPDVLEEMHAVLAAIRPELTTG